ncbi:MAG: protease [Sulfurimonas sp. RIFOXYD12_FULL_33_39]|uniref:M16 family metallopeptidase n=1 Tax=unclassified Sulfurimonas TaxID=2623549 RepID=UPI0008CD86F4|nr:MULTISPECIES: pitrilysin family protein [unclassified Sulfurimonas]OHE07786.1 MAG: protease [Sulfurimonas sp. RIFCSPLOWO2_12_FULL_34_6]OHE09293.1 MAG: protease [Sulfurimonas sp. RIFOXYD12_FULL_33_39]OHE12924.1 MAG: protease [Sulfurimonas sp. RIFOXYD2_FULL_34_21]
MASSLPKYETKTLKNGLQIVVIPLKNSTNVISTDIFYKVGSRNEVMGKTGIAHMLEHMNFKSTKNLDAGEFDKEVKSIGGVNNASTSFDYTHYYIKSSTQNLGKSLELYAELMKNLKLKDEEFQPERDVVAEERRWRTENSPMGYLYFALFNNAYVYHPYHWTPIGFMNDIKTWTLKDIKDFHKTYYQPNNAILMVTGDVEAEEVFKKADKEFSKIKNRAKIPEFKFIEPEQNGAKRVVIHKESEVEMLAITFHIPDFKDKDQLTLNVISEILFSGKSSRLYKELIEKKRLVNTIYAYNMENIDPGLFIFLATCNPGVKAEDVEKELVKEIELIKNKKVDEKEIEKVKINTKADFIYSLESSTSVAELFGSYLVRGDLTPLLNYEENIQKITVDMIQEAANKYFNFDKSTTLILKK